MQTVKTFVDAVYAECGLVETDSGVSSIGLTVFKQAVYPWYVHTRFQAQLDELLTQVARYVESGGVEGLGRLMIFMPPRHGKSLTVSRLFPSWFIGRNPDKRMIMASYGTKLANRNSRFVRNLIKDTRYAEFFPGVSLADDTASAQEWDIAGREGGAIAAGVGSGITGHGAHLLIIDDPIKSRAEAESETYRTSLKEWYGDAYTRLEEPGAAVIIMHTRWHEDDLAGHLLADSADDWRVLSLPAIAGEEDPLGRAPGEALWPERYSADKLVKVEETLGDYRFSAEYQQSPKPKSGGLFDTQLIEVVDFVPECKDVVRFYDLAVTARRRSDYTVGVKMGVMTDESPVVLDVWRAQKTAPDIQEAIVQNARIDGPKVRIRLEAEKAGIVELDYLLRDERMRPYTIDAVPPSGDKYTRAGPFAARVKAGKVKMVRGSWNRAYLDELAMFPNASNDDQVDGSSGAYDMLGEDRTIHVGRAPDVLANYRGS
jgi:predicted phage terminase large subunit-like protein